MLSHGLVSMKQGDGSHQDESMTQGNGAILSLGNGSMKQGDEGYGDGSMKQGEASHAQQWQ